MRAQTRHTLGSRHREKKRIGIEERCSGASGDGTDIRTDDEASRAISYRVCSFVRSVPCSHRALQSATDSPPLTPLQRPSTPLRPSSPSGEENRKQRLPPLPQRRTWFLRNRPIAPLRTTLRACHVGRYVARDWPAVWRAGVLSNRTCPRARRRLLPHPPRNYRETIPPLFPPPRLDKRPRRNKEKRVCLRESTLVNPTARDLNKSAGLSRALSPTLTAYPILPTHSIFLYSPTSHLLPAYIAPLSGFVKSPSTTMRRAACFHASRPSKTLLRLRDTKRRNVRFTRTPFSRVLRGTNTPRMFRGNWRVTSVTKRNDSRNSSGSKLLWFINKKWSSKVLERSSCMQNEPRKIFFHHPVDRNRDKVGDTSRKMRVPRIVSNRSRRDLAGNEDRTSWNMYE